MGELFNLDNKFFQGINKIVDCICLSFLWVLLCIPVVTAGAATTALYYTVNKVIRNNRSYIWKEFWHAFRTNFKQSTLVWLILIFIYVIMGIDCYIMFQYAKAGVSYGSLYIVFAVLMLIVTMWANYLFPYMARFENTLKAVLKNCVIMALLNLGKSVVLLVLFLAAFVVTYVFFPAIMILPAVYMLLANFILEKVFVKYMTPEDIEAEKERNEEFFN